MTRKTDSSLINKSIQLVRDGFSVSTACKETGISISVLRRAIKQFEVKTPESIAKEKLDSISKDMISMYQNGESENSVAKHFNVSRNVVRRYIKEFEIKPRTQSEAEALKWSKMTEEQRNAQVKPAHDSVRGVKKTEAAKIALAKARERIKYNSLIGPGEIELVQLLNDRGIKNVHQKAIKFYNVDIAVGNIAVELTLDRSRYTSFNPKEIKRAKNLLECGYYTLAVQFDKESTLIACGDDIIAAIDEMSRLEPFTSEYWVVSCRSQDYTITKNNLGQFSREQSPVKFVTKRSVIQL